jgi:hypothetical protein
MSHPVRIFLSLTRLDLGILLRGPCCLRLGVSSSPIALPFRARGFRPYILPIFNLVGHQDANVLIPRDQPE